MSFGRAFSISFLTSLVMIIVAQVWNYIYYTFVKPDYFDELAGTMRAYFEDQGMSEEQIEASLGGVGSQLTLEGFLWAVGMMAVICLIIAAVMKKDQPLYD